VPTICNYYFVIVYTNLMKTSKHPQLKYRAQN